jgi:cysteine dioxygenase
MPFIQENSSSHPGRRDGDSGDDFEELVQQLSDVLGPCSGLDSEEIDPDVIQQLMRSYTSMESEWEQYALLDPSKPYTRNLVDEGNGKSNLVGGKIGLSDWK